MTSRQRLARALLIPCLGFAQLAAVILPAPTALSEPLTESALEGLWYGEPLFNGQRGHLAIRLKRDAKGRNLALLSMLDIDVRDVPVGIVKIDANRVTIGDLTIDYDPDARTLSGTIPADIAPVHAIRFVLKRVSELPAAAAAPAAAPNRTADWTFESGSAVWGGLTTSTGRLFFGNDSGEVIALDTKSGKPLWRFSTGGAIRSRPELAGGDLLVASDDGFVYRLASADGALRWRARVGKPATRTKAGDQAYAYDSYGSAPTLSGAMVFVGSGHDLVALDAASGAERWRYITGGAIATKPAVAEGTLFVGSNDGKLYAVDAASGEVRWSHDFGAAVTSSPAVSGDRVIAGSRSYDLAALRIADGTPVWTQYFWFSWVESSPVIDKGSVFVGSSDGQKLHAFDASSGKESWFLDTGGSAWAQPAVSTRRVYIGSVGVAHYLVDHRATLWAVDRNSGKAAWRFDLPQPEGVTMWGFAASPAIDDNQLYAASLDGRVYAFAK